MKKLVMCGCHTGGHQVIQAILEQGYLFEYFVCLTPEQSQKYKISGYYDYTNLAHKYDIPVYFPVNYSLNSEQDRVFFQQHKFDLLIQGGWQRLFPEYLITSLGIGAVGIHGSSDYLPKGRGRSPMNWSLIEGRKRFIMHLFLMKPDVDDGDVFDTEIFDITEFDDINTMYYKYSIVYKNMIIRSLPQLLANQIIVKPQLGSPSYYPKRNPEDGIINWEEMDVWQIYNFVRAQTHPYPGAYCKINGINYRIWKCRVFDTRLTYPNAHFGECVEEFDNHKIINCRGGLLLLDDYTIES